MVVRTFLPYSKIVKKPQKQQYADNPQTLGEHIRKKRIEARQTQLEVSQIIGVDEETVYGWERGMYVPQVRSYPGVIAFLGYYPFMHETESIAGKLLQLRYCKGFSCKQMALVLECDTATERRWELKKTAVNVMAHAKIVEYWSQLLRSAKQQYRSE